MAYDPKPVSLTQVATGSYTGTFDPQPMIVVGGVPVTATELVASLKALTGYDVAKTQTLKNVTGTLTWVTDTP